MSGSHLHSKKKISTLVLSACLLLGGQAANAAYYCDAETDLVGPSHGTALSPIPVTAENTFLLTPERMAAMQAKIESGDFNYLRFIKKINQISSPKKAHPMEFALAYRLTGNTHYRDMAKAAFNLKVQNDPLFGTTKACDRNYFRTAGRQHLYYYNWMYDTFTEQEREQLIRHFAVWAEYWMNYVETAYKGGDTDENTALAENFTLLGLALEGTAVGDRVMAMADDMFERIVIGRYLDDIFKGGVWGEGPGYAANTITHWALTFLINKEVRGKQYDFNPEDYIHESILGYIYKTLPGHTGNWKMGDMEHAVSYFNPELARRLQRSVAIFSGATTNDFYKKLANDWLGKMELQWPIGDGDLNTLFTNVLFEDVNVGSISPQSAGLPLTFSAEGLDFHHFRSSWSDDASSFYITSTDAQAHHANADAMHFEIARKGHWLTKEITGYDGIAWFGQSHNTLLIENMNTYKGKNGIDGRYTGREGSNFIGQYPVHDGDIIMKATAPNFNYVVAEATGPYSEAGHYYTNHAQHLTRQVANLNNDAYIVFDHVITDKNDIRDIIRWQDQLDPEHAVFGPHPKVDFPVLKEYVRKVDYVQHFESKPELDGEFYSTQEPESKQQLKYKTLLPVDHTQIIIDEKERYKDVRGSSVPLNQLKWQIKVTANERSTENRFLHTMFTGDEGQVATPSEQIVLNKESGYITSKSDDITGVAMNFNGEWHIALFNDKPTVNMSNVNYQTPFVGADESVHHYVFGIGNGQYDISMENGEVIVSRESGDSNNFLYETSNNTLYYRTNNEALALDEQAPSIPAGLETKETDKDEIIFSWSASNDDVGVAGYHVYRDDSESPIATVYGTSFADSGLDSSSNYRYQVSAFDLVGNTSELSSEFSATTREADYFNTARLPVRKTTTSTGTSSKPVPDLHIDPRAVAFDEPLDTYLGVYPAPESTDVDYRETELVLQFASATRYKWTDNRPLLVHNLDTGAIVHSVDPEALDEQEGLSNFTVKLDNSILKPDTRYGVTVPRAFTNTVGAPWKSGAITSGMWTFTTMSEVPAETTPLAEPVALVEGVYPAPDSTGVSYNKPQLAIDFAAPIDFRWTRYAPLMITNLDNGAVAYTLDPDEFDEQIGQTRYVLELEPGILKPNTRYGVTTAYKFAIMQQAPYKSEAISEGLWTFTTKDGNAVEVEEVVPLAEPMPLLAGVYPASGSTDVDPVNAKLILNFDVGAGYRWTEGADLAVRNLDTGEVVYSIDPDEFDAQHGAASYTIQLGEHTLQANTRYGVTTKYGFANMNKAPYKLGAITEGLWTFTTQ